MDSTVPHIPVLYEEVLTGLQVVPGGFYIDGTVGAGGHAQGILQASAPDGRLLGLDVDPNALRISRQRLERFGDRVTLVRSNFAAMEELVSALGLGQADGVLLDLGVSSMQLADAAGGFSFQLEGPLDMRLDPEGPRTAADIVNGMPERDLADLIFRYGQERASRAIAREIVAARPLQTTTELAEVVCRAVRRRKIHPATRTFQALRIAVNEELSRLEQGLNAAMLVLRPGGRLVAIAFHSLEDGVVKQFFARESRDCICPPEAMVCVCGHRATLALVTKKPIRPHEHEIHRNPRSRSARLRIATRR